MFGDRSHGSVTTDSPEPAASYLPNAENAQGERCEQVAASKGQRGLVSRASIAELVAFRIAYPGQKADPSGEETSTSSI